MFTDTLVYDQRARREVRQLRRVAGLIVTDTVAALPEDLSELIFASLMINAGVIRFDAEPMTMHLSLCRSFARTPSLAAAACLSMEVASHLHGVMREDDDVVAAWIEPSNWRPRAALPPKLKPIVRAFRNEIPSRYNELKTMKLNQLWGIAQPRLAAKGIIEWCPAPVPDH